MTLTKGYLENKKTGDIQRFQYNPETFSDKRQVTYAQIKSPGISYPRYQYIGGEARELTFELFVDEHEHKSGIKNWQTFFYNVLPTPNSGKRYTQPPTVLFAFGKYVQTCVVTNVDTQFTMFDKSLKAIRATFNVTLLVIQ